MLRRKFDNWEKVVGNDKRAWFRGRRGIILGYGPNKAEYFVLFDDGTMEFVNSWWLDRAV